MTIINTNVAATITSNALAKNDRAMGQAMERLSTGQRINSASDDDALDDNFLRTGQRIASPVVVINLLKVFCVVTGREPNAVLPTVCIS